MRPQFLKDITEDNLEEHKARRDEIGARVRNKHGRIIMELPLKKKGGWIGVDFDGTLVEYEGWKGCDHHGTPIMSMVNRVKVWLDNGFEVRIFTARVGPAYPEQVQANAQTIQSFCLEHFGRPLIITHEKDQNMICLWDDRAFNPTCRNCSIL